jgi:hypothetical protein
MHTAMVTGLTLASSVVGALLTGGAVWLRLRGRLCPDVAAHQLTDDDRAALAAEFSAHASAVRQQLAAYADALADGDPTLRDRLRHHEALR